MVLFVVQEYLELHVSCVIPTFNRCDSLIAAIESVASQTKLVDEIIVVDDGSSDGTDSVLENFRRHRPNVVLRVLRQANRGPAAARNAGINLARGDYIAFLDDDDIWLPTKLERQCRILAENPTVALLGCATDTIWRSGGSRLVPIGEWDLLFRNWFLTPSVLAKRDILLASGGFPEEMSHCEDYSLWLRIASSHRCAFLNEVLVICGHGKPAFGHSGLSADLRSLYTGELEAISRWQADRNAGFPAFSLARLLARMRHLRRHLVVARQRVK